MRITIQFDDDDTLKEALQEHLDTGRSIQDYIIGSIRFYKAMIALENEGQLLGYCHVSNKQNFEKFNHSFKVSDYV